MGDILLERLMDGQWHSGEALSADMGVTRAAVWKQVEALRNEGVIIESAGKRGYRMTMPDDPLYPPLFAADGCAVHYSYEIDSTNIKATALARTGAPEGTLVIAEIQTGGRGRRERGWSSPPGGLWFSMVLRPNLPPVKAQRIPLLAAVAVAEACEGCAGVYASVKWPNDVMIDGRKVCGILMEMSVEGERVSYITMGVGINAAVMEFPEELRERAASLSAESGHTVRRGDVLRAFINTFWGLYHRLEAEGDAFYREEFLPEYIRRSNTVGRHITVINDGATRRAFAESIGGSGELIVRFDDGQVCPVWAGDVSVRGDV